MYNQLHSSNSHVKANSKSFNINDGSSGARGITYETRVCMLFVVRGYMRGLKDFQLRYQVTEAGKFDDVVFYDGEKYQLIQLKHKENKLKISHSQLFTDRFNTDYNLIKYVQAYDDANSTERFNDKINLAVVFTNIDFDLKGNKLSLMTNQRPSAKIWYGGLELIELVPFTLDASAIFDTSNIFPVAKCYKFDQVEDIDQILKRQADTLLHETQGIQKQKTTSQRYWNRITSIFAYIFSSIASMFRCNDCSRHKSQQTKLKKQEEDLVNYLRNLTEAKILEALRCLVYAVRQPNDKELEKIIKDEIRDHFKLLSTKIIYNELEKQFRDWCDRKEPLDQSLTSNQSNPQEQHVISYKDADDVFQKHVKTFSFGVTSPTSSFTGRVNEVKNIREKLRDNRNLIISQTVAISGLGGIGKTELAKQFIRQFGQTDFYGRVIWIEAESDESVKNSFESLAEKLNIVDRTIKAITTLIDEVFEYFNGFKVLFVFDNFHKTPGSDKQNLVVHCRKSASDSTKDHRPYFLFTSRNRECLPGLSSLDLSVLTKEDAIMLIKSELIDINYNAQDVTNLAETLQYFPLALQQAIAYINRQHKIENESGGRYDIQAYLIKFSEEKGKLLAYQFSDDFGDCGKTTFVTWNVTLDAITKDETNGPNAIKVLQFLSYLYADKIDPKMFLSLFDNDSSCLGEAFLLLEKYSMITKTDEKTTNYQIHRLVQAVVQLKFKKNEEEILRKAMELIDPQLYDSCIGESQHWLLVLNLMKKCTIDQFFHYKSLSSYIRTNENLKKKFSKFFDDLHDRFLLAAALKNDVVKIRTLNVSEEDLKEFIRRHIRHLLFKQAHEIIKYFIENGYLGLNERIGNHSVLELSIRFCNFSLFKNLVEKGADLSEVAKPVSNRLISDIKNGNIDSIQTLISQKSEISLLKELLFVATLFNQVSMVQLLIDNGVKADDELEDLNDWTPIIVAAKLNYTKILEIFFKKYYDKIKVKDILFKLLDDEDFWVKNSFEIIFKRYRELGGDINDRFKYNNKSTFLCRVTCFCFVVEKIEIVQFLLDNGADPFLTNNHGDNALVYILKKLKEDGDIDDKSPFEDIYQKIISKISREKFITGIRDSLFIKVRSIHFDKDLKLFDMLLKEIDDKNIKNDKGETLLVNYVRYVKICQEERHYFKILPRVHILKFLVEAGVDVEAKDNDGKNALYYALELNKDDISMSLLSKVRSVDDVILIKAIQEDTLSIVEKLLENHFSVDHIFSNDTTPIELAVEHNSLNIILFLNEKLNEFYDRGGNVNIKDELGRTLLIKYVEQFRYKNVDDLSKVLDNIKLLVENGADVDAKDTLGKTALYYAAECKDIDIFMYLLRKVRLVGEDILIAALRYNRLQIVKALIPQYFRKDYLFTSILYKNRTPVDLSIEYKEKDIQIYLGVQVEIRGIGGLTIPF